MITILPDFKVPSWDPKHFDSGWHDVMGLEEALLTSWPTDAMLLPYFIEERQPDGTYKPLPVAPRLRKSDLAFIEEQGFRVRFRWGILDLDNATAHGDKSEASDEWRAEVRAVLARVAPAATTYDTRSGMRVLWRLADDLTVPQYEDELHNAALCLEQAGVAVDRLPWNQCHRLPRVVRDGVPQSRWVDPEAPGVWVPRPKATVTPRTTSQSLRWQKFALPREVGPGERHAMLKGLAASLRAKGFSREEMLDALQQADLEVCKPPVQSEPDGPAEIESLVNHFCRLDPGLSPEFKAQAALPPPPPTPQADAAPEPMRRGDSKEIADRVIALLEAPTHGHGPDGGVVPLVYAEGLCWLYQPDRGIYGQVSDSMIAQKIMALAGTPVVSGVTKDGVVKYRLLQISARTVDDVVKCIQWQREDAEYFTKAPHGVAFTSGFAQVSEGTVQQWGHSPIWRARFAYDFAWTDEPPQMWLEFQRQVYSPLGQEDGDRCARVLGEMCGASLCGFAPRYEKMAYLFGVGSNGKSVELNTISACFPPGTVSYYSPNELDSVYAQAELVGKLINLASEMPAIMIDQKESATIKKIVSGEPLNARRIYKSPFMFRPKCLLIASLNGLPKVADRSDGFYRRAILLPHLRQWMAGEQDVNLADRLIAADKQRIVCWWVRAAATLLARGRYDEPKISREYVEEWRKGLDPVRIFVEDALEPDEQGTSCPLIYQHYRTWAQRQGHTVEDSSTFWRRFSSLAQSRYGAALCGPKNQREKRYFVKFIED